MQVDKQRFLYLLNNYRSLTDRETTELMALQKQFPYSQVIRNITTWGAYHNSLPSLKTQLYIASLYATNRKLLKTLVTAPRIERNGAPVQVEKHEKLQQKVVLQAKMPEQVKKSQPTISTASHINKVLSRLPEGLQNLKKNRHDFEKIMKSVETSLNPNINSIQNRPVSKGIGLKKSIPKKTIRKPKKSITKKKAPKKVLAVKKTAKKTVASTQKKLSTAKKKASGKAIKKSLPKKRALKSVAKKVSSKKKPAKKKAVSGKKVAKKKLVPQKKSIKAAKLDDLSKTSYTLNKRAISETLVQLLIAQGKKNEAIEILKKLIWKTPQKKALFMSQIKALEALS